MAKTVEFDVLAVAETKGFDESSRKLDQQQRQLDKLAKTDLDKSTDKWTDSMKGLVGTLATVGPAAIPIAAVAAPALLTLGLGFGSVEKKLHALGPEFERLQGVAGKSLAPGVDALIHSVEKAEPQLDQLIGVFGNAISGELESISHAIDNGGLKEFITYAEDELPKVESTFNATAAATFHLVEALKPFGDQALEDVHDAAELTNQVAQLAAGFEHLAGQVKIGNFGLADAAKYANPLTDAVKIANFTLSQSGPVFDKVTSSLFGVGGAIEFTGQVIGGFNTKAQGTAGSVGMAIGSTNGLTIAQQNLVDKTMSETTQLGFLNTELDKLSNFALDAEQMELHFKDALAGATDQVKQNGSAINDNTAKGRSNKEWLLTQIQTINSHATAVGKQTGSVEAATRALSGDEAQLRSAATAAGLNTQQVDALIRKYAATPKQVETAIKADTRNALGGISDVQAHLALLHDHSITLTTYIQEEILPTLDRSGQAHGTSTGEHSGPGRAQGGPVYKGRTYQVLEKRSELFTPSMDGYISPRVPASGAIGGGPTVLEVRSGGAPLDDLLVQLIRKYVRVNGGDVQTVLGQ